MIMILRGDTARQLVGVELDDIWDELNDDDVTPKIIIDEKQKVKASSLNRLVERMTGDARDPKLVPAVLCTLHCFTTPDILLQKLIQRYNVPFDDAMGEEAFVSRVQKPIQTKVVEVMNNWINNHYTGMIYDDNTISW